MLRQEFLCVEGTGGAVWRPSIRFAEFVCSQEGRRSLPIAGKSVLEISSGLGLGAIVAWRLGASPVVSKTSALRNNVILVILSCPVQYVFFF